MFRLFRRKNCNAKIEIADNARKRLAAEQKFHAAQIEQLDAIIANATECRNQHFRTYTALGDALYSLDNPKLPRMTEEELFEGLNSLDDYEEGTWTPIDTNSGNGTFEPGVVEGVEVYDPRIEKAAK